MCPYGSGIRGIARVHLPESYFLLPSITGQPCIAHICARAFRISSFSFPRAVRQLCFFPLPSERKKEIFFEKFRRVKFICSKIRSWNRSERGGGWYRLSPSSRLPQITAKRDINVQLWFYLVIYRSTRLTFLPPLLFRPIFFPHLETLFCYTHSWSLSRKNVIKVSYRRGRIIEIGKLTI